MHYVCLNKDSNKMALIKSVRGFEPQISESSFLAENACLIGDIEMGENCSFWYHSVVRGDVSAIKLGNLVNVQDGAIIHGTYKQSKTIVGNSVSIGHRAILHGCTVEDKVLIGMGAIVMDHAIIGSGSIIAAGAVVLKGTIVPPNSVFCWCSS